MLKVLGWISEAQSNFWVAGQTNGKPSVGTLQRDWAFKATAHQPSQLWDVSKRVLKTGLFFLAAAWRKYIKSAFTTHKNWYLTKGNIFITSEDVPSLNSWRELIAVWSAEEFDFLRFRIILANATKSLRVAKYTYFHDLLVCWIYFTRQINLLHCSADHPPLLRIVFRPSPRIRDSSSCSSVTEKPG